MVTLTKKSVERGSNHFYLKLCMIVMFAYAGRTAKSGTAGKGLSGKGLE